MFRPIQPQFNLRVRNGKREYPDMFKGSSVLPSSDEDSINIEQYVNYPVIYEERADMLNTLQFTVDKYADVLLYYFCIGQEVELFGGYYADNENSMRKVFAGTVTRIKTNFSDNGKVAFTVECMSYGFTKLGKDTHAFVYPDSNSPRSFARADSLDIYAIIKGIAEVNGCKLGKIELSSKARSVTYDKSKIKYQRDASDWKFLTDLASSTGSTVWISSEDGEEKINFVSHEKAIQEQSDDIGFLYPLYSMAIYKNNPLIKDYEIQKFSNPAYNRPRILREVTVDEDISQAYAVSRSAIYFDKETGEQKEVTAVTTEKDGKSKVIFYELDEQRVAMISHTRPDIADKILKGGPTSMKWGDSNDPESASYYYREIEEFDEQTAVFDRAFFGITVTAKCNQDLDIHTCRTYKIRGILSYHSRNIDTAFFLRGLKHVWDRDGTWTELDFIR